MFSCNRCLKVIVRLYLFIALGFLSSTAIQTVSFNPNSDVVITSGRVVDKQEPSQYFRYIFSSIHLSEFTESNFFPPQ